jgi:predicted translin family RNA/ssDNA-binding protein
MFEKDYIMHLIGEMVRAFLKLIFNIDLDTKESQVFNETEIAAEYDELITLVDDGKINEAENKLLAGLNSEDIQDFKLALMFYSYLNEKDIDFLAEHDFSKKEITDGLKHVSKVYGYESMANAFLSILPD